VIELLQFTPDMGLMNASPFCMKVEVFLRLAGLEYRVVEALPLAAPKGKLPVLRDGERVVADSEAILEYLREAYGARLPPALAAPETPAQHLLRRTIEEHLYFAALHWRWLEPAGTTFTRRFFARAPAPARGLVFALVQRKMRRDLHGQGLGRHEAERIAAKASADLDAVAASLGDAPYFAGSEPGAIDACVYAFLANLIWVPVDSPLKTHALGCAPLLGFAGRMRERVGS